MPASRSFIIALLLVLLLPARAARAGSTQDLTEDSLRAVARIARAISVVQPYLKDSEYIEYGLDIYRASRRYRIEPAVLIAIAQQETGFRNNLPEGAAGEIGICQIRKNWLKHAGFRKEFRRARLRDLHKPAMNFLFAAWILKGLKDNAPRKSLPYWSYYNAVRFENRMKYYLAVSRYISTLKRHEDYFSDRAVAANAPETRPTTPLSRAYRSPVGIRRIQIAREANLEAVRASVARWVPSSRPTKTDVSGDEALRLALSRWNPRTETPKPITGSPEPHWIPNALSKAPAPKNRSVAGENRIAVRKPDSIKTDRDFNANLTRAASILDVREFMGRAQD